MLFHSRLADGEALRITKTSSITMLFMRFAIDAVFLDRRGRVVRAAADLRPWLPMIAARGAAEVVELRAGTIAESGTQAGDDLVFDDAR
ncbi:MAG: DUF192 domain-containing protein [Chloroflexota bacterium]|nr:DUF192 domain-containing protein [Chloroflexota bacterium]